MRACALADAAGREVRASDRFESQLRVPALGTAVARYRRRAAPGALAAGTAHFTPSRVAVCTALYSIPTLVTINYTKYVHILCIMVVIIVSSYGVRGVYHYETINGNIDKIRNKRESLFIYVNFDCFSTQQLTFFKCPYTYKH